MTSEIREICPLRWLSSMIQLIPGRPHEPLFLVMSGKSNQFPITSGQINRLLKKWTDKAMLEDTNFSSHCMCRGGLNWAHDAQISGENLQIMGGWSSQAYLRYLDIDYDRRIQGVRKMMTQQAKVQGAC